MPSEIIELRLTRQEAHIILRALASHNADNANRGDHQPCTWIAERILRLVSPELGPQPLAAIMHGADDACVKREQGEAG